MLAGYIAIWATDVNDDNGTADSAADALDNAAAGSAIAPATAVPADVNAEVTPAPNDDNPAVACVPNVEASATTCAPNCENQLPNPAKLIGGTLNCDNVEATDVAPA